MKHYFNTTFLFILIGLVGVASFFILQPFVTALLLAFVLSQLFEGWYKRALKLVGKKNTGWASFITCTLIFLIIFVPIVLIGTLAAAEANSLRKTFAENHLAEKFSESIKYTLANENWLSPFLTPEKLSDAAKSIGNLGFDVVKKTYEGTVSFIFMTFVMFFSLYYFFKDGHRLIKKVMDLSPLKNSEEELLLKKFIGISRATLKGTLVIAIIQAALTGFIFLITGTPSAILLGLLTILVSLIPMMGAAIVWAPVGILMIMFGHVWEGVTILIFGAVVVSTIDNILRPKLVGNEASLHPLLVLLATLGGIALFGISGFLLGPVIIVLFITLLDIYKLEFGKDLKRFNK